MTFKRTRLSTPDNMHHVHPNRDDTGKGFSCRWVSGFINTTGGYGTFPSVLSLIVVVEESQTPVVYGVRSESGIHGRTLSPPTHHLR